MDISSIMDNDSGYSSTCPESHFIGHDESRDNLSILNDSNANSSMSSSKKQQKPLKYASAKVTRTLFGDDEKENINPKTPQKCYPNCFNADLSPDLFSDSECGSATKKGSRVSPSKRKNGAVQSNKDAKLLKRVQDTLSGVCPPPNFTTTQITPQDMLQKIEANKHLFWTDSTNGHCWSPETKSKSLLVANSWEEANSLWPKILTVRYHGLHHNRSKVSEEVEHLCSRYAERYVGVETQSSCTVFESNLTSPSKKKSCKPKWVSKSPGRRLSHLARRRITFSSSNLQASSSASILGTKTRQILVDVKRHSSLVKKKSPRKSPRKTPSKSPKKGNSPNTSSVLSIKRALFSSPLKDINQPSTSSGMPSLEKHPTKRALFISPSKRSPHKLSAIFDRKRKRIDSEDENSTPATTLHRSMSLELRSNSASSLKMNMNRTLSDSLLARPEELSEVHKKKLQWAVYEALRLQNITSTHPQFKQFASTLARVTRKFLPSIKTEGRTTEKMFRMARYHSYAVIKGKSVDEIISDYLKNKAKNQKPQGYVALQPASTVNKSVACSENSSSTSTSSTVLQDKANIIESIEKRRQLSGSRLNFFNENRIDRIRKVISFDDSEKA